MFIADILYSKDVLVNLIMNGSKGIFEYLVLFLKGIVFLL